VHLILALACPCEFGFHLPRFSFPISNILRFFCTCEFLTKSAATAYLLCIACSVFGSGYGFGIVFLLCWFFQFMGVFNWANILIAAGEYKNNSVNGAKIK
jgi:hypothetical protein